MFAVFLKILCKHFLLIVTALFKYIIIIENIIYVGNYKCLHAFFSIQGAAKNTPTKTVISQKRLLISWRNFPRLFAIVYRKNLTIWTLKRLYCHFRYRSLLQSLGEAFFKLGMVEPPKFAVGILILSAIFPQIDIHISGFGGHVANSARLARDCVV